MWIQPLLLTLQLMAVSVIIATVIGIVGAWAATSLEGSGRPGRMMCRSFLALLLVAVAMPLILHAAAWEATAGKFGWMIMTQTGASTLSTRTNTTQTTSCRRPTSIETLMGLSTR